MSLFKNVLKDNETIIKNNFALDYEFLPEILPFRENEQQYLATCIKPLFNNRNGRNILIHGAPGIGKTAATKFVLKQLEDETDAIEPIYVNCWQKNTSYKILLEICDLIGYKFTQNKKTVELFKIVSTILNKKSVVFVFDEIDKVEDLDFLYFVLEEIYKKSIFLITNYKSWLADLDERIKSRLLPEILEFKQYTFEETKKIIDVRVKAAFFNDVISVDLINDIARKTSQIKDIRSGIFLLKEAAYNAEDSSRKEIIKDDVLKAIKKLDDFTIKNTADLERDTQLIYDIVKNNSGKKIGALYTIYKDQKGAYSYKTFQRKIEKLEEGKFIKTTKQVGAGGNTTIVEKKLNDF